MAYKERFRFNFNSQAGKDLAISILQDGYTGSVLTRALGGSPRLAIEQSDCVRGSSLTFEAECVIDDEYADLYTSDPLKYKVQVKNGSALVWEGFITPELYAAPWIDPPYNVTLTATDGLGELKRYTFAAQGETSLSSLLTYLLAFTGLNYPVRLISSLAVEGGAAASFLSTTVNLDSYAGKTCYDVLQALLVSIHATVVVRQSAWLVMRETDIAGAVDGASVKDLDGGTYPIVSFGSMQTSAVWPVGQLSMEIEPARKSVAVECPNTYLTGLLPVFPGTSWTCTGSEVDDGLLARCRRNPE
jgi:hypothetical protein